MNSQNVKFLLALSLSLSLIVSSTASAGDMKNSRLMPEGKVIVSREGKAIAEYSREMPVPEGALLTCQGRCAAKLDDMLLVAEDQSQFTVDIKNHQRILKVQQGIVYFGLSNMPRTIVFLTPDGAVSADRVFINASSGTNMLEGYVKGSAGYSELGVLSGGSLTLMTTRGVNSLKSGDRFVFDLAGMGAAGGLLSGGANLGLSGGAISAIEAVSVAGGGILFTPMSNNINNDGDDDGSPSAPSAP